MHYGDFTTVNRVLQHYTPHDTITITHILQQQLIALFDLLTFTALTLTAHRFPCLSDEWACEQEAGRDGLISCLFSGQVKIEAMVWCFTPSALLHKLVLSVGE